MYYGFEFMPRFNLISYFQKSKSNLLFEDSILVFLLVSHPLEYHHGHDGNRFIGKPCLPMKPFGLAQKSFDFIVESTTSTTISSDILRSRSKILMLLILIFQHLIIKLFLLKE
jgi:hypothetical protein